MKNGIELIKEERQRQIEVEGWTAEHDKQFKNDELFNAAASYSAREGFRNEDDNSIPSAWPFDPEWWKPTPNDRIKELVKSGALFMAHEKLTGSTCGGHIASCARRIDKLLKNENKS